MIIYPQITHNSINRYDKGEIMKEKINVDEVLSAYRSDKDDPLGSYTGKPIDNGMPVQDADDL